HLGGPPGIELQPGDENRLQLVDDFLGFHGPPARFVRLALRPERPRARSPRAAHAKNRSTARSAPRPHAPAPARPAAPRPACARRARLSTPAPAPPASPAMP